MGRKKVLPQIALKVKILLEEGYNKSEIAAKCKVSRKFVYNVQNKVQKNLPIANLAGQGRRRCTTTAQDRLLVRKAKANRTASSRELAIEMIPITGKPISARTVRRRMLENGLKSYTQKKRPFHNKKQIKKRLDWCRSRLGWTTKEWSKVCFSDESHFEVLNRKNRLFVRRTREEQDMPFNFATRTQGGGGCVSVWGCFTINGTGLLLSYDGRLNAARYISMLADELPPHLDDLYGLGADDWYFQQDNAPCHKAKKTMEWFEDNGIPVLDWPPTSPDLNPIENLWEIIDQQLPKYVIRNTSDLSAAIQDIWQKIPVEQCVKLIESMPKRVKAVYKAKGKNIPKY